MAQKIMIKKNEGPALETVDGYLYHTYLFFGKRGVRTTVRTDYLKKSKLYRTEKFLISEK